MAQLGCRWKSEVEGCTGGLHLIIFIRTLLLSCVPLVLSSLRWKEAICPLIVIEERHDSTKRTSTMVLADLSFLASRW
jgi:hypothetical protein